MSVDIGELFAINIFWVTNALVMVTFTIYFTLHLVRRFMEAG